jgi:hypothetical protein
MITSATIEFRNCPPVQMDPADVQHFISGEIPPRIADHYVAHGMPRRGLVRFQMTVQEQSGTRIIGPNLARRAGTASSAVER